MEGALSLERAQNKFLSKVYGWMTLALIISGAVAYFSAHSIAIFSDGHAVRLNAASPLFALLVGNKIGYIVLTVLDLGLVFTLSLFIPKMRASTAALMFALYSVVNGLTFATIFIIYTQTSIFQIFLVSAVMFGVMAIYGSLTKTNLMTFGKYFAMAMIGIVVATILNIFLHSNGLSTIVSIVGVVLFTGLSAYDAQKMMRVSRVAGSGGEQFDKASIIGALELYLDFINIFLRLLQLFGKRND